LKIEVKGRSVAAQNAVLFLRKFSLHFLIGKRGGAVFFGHGISPVASTWSRRRRKSRGFPEECARNAAGRQALCYPLINVLRA
jgi:hypothetical protein